MRPRVRHRNSVRATAHHALPTHASSCASGHSSAAQADRLRKVGIAVWLENGIGLSPVRTEPPLPFRLEPGSSERWWVEGAEVRAAMAASKLARSKVHIAVGLGTGKVVKTRSILLP
jgi:hypothetical protein